MSTRAEPRPAPFASPVVLTAALLGVALAAWIVTIERMRGMDAGPGTDLGGLGWYLGVWVTMMAAMMLPSAAPMVLLFSKVARNRERQGRSFAPTWVFASGYLAAWTVYGLGAFGLYRAVAAADLGFLDWDRQGPIVAGAALAAAGLYELTPLKAVCLRHCRSPLHFVLHGWRPGWLGALRMGVEHGGYCVGCCFGLMLILFALGVMSLLWMAVVFLQKVLPLGERVGRALAVLLVATGIWVAAAPGSLPGLVDPTTVSMTHMDGSMQNGDTMTRDGSGMEGGSSTQGSLDGASQQGGAGR